MKLSGEQNGVLAKFMRRDSNTLILGKAGTGKSVLLRTLRDKARYHNLKGFVCSPTGISAINVGGCTIHSLIINLRIGEGRLDYLILDEVSMVRVDLLDELDEALRSYTRVPRPFGGVKVFMFGDVAQLPPVLIRNSADERFIQEHYKSMYFFSSKVYASVEWDITDLTTIFRQQGEGSENYIKLLNLVREGENVKSVKALNSMFVVDNPEGIVLCSTNKAAETINNALLEELSSPPTSYEASISGTVKDNEKPAPQTLTLKVGASVMVVKNLYTEEGVLRLVNGDWCEVTETCDNHVVVHCARTNKEHHIGYEEWPKHEAVYDAKTKSVNRKETGKYSQLPIRLAWAVTIHKSQGATLDNYTIDLRRPLFSPGQLYVALSRGTNLEGLNILGKVRKKDVMVCPVVQKFLKDYKFGVGIKKGSRFDNKTSSEVFKETLSKKNLGAML